MSSKVILAVVDGLRNDTAAAQMGYLESLVEHGVADRYIVNAEMPSMSRPLYETIHTGLPAYKHGITNNSVVQRSKMPNVFEIAAKNGRVTAAAAYFWVSELYNATPYDPVEHSEVDNPSLAIQHGRFYMQDEFPDAALFAQAERMVRRYEPDYLLIHPMGMDNTGHHHGAPSSQYDNHAIFIDQTLANQIPSWLDRGYTILVTADHGMNSNHMHGGSGSDVRHVPLYVIRPGIGASQDPHSLPLVSQLSIAPTLLHLLGLPVPATMQSPPLF
jgi:predicted AlkP superfamily pyrophosphatase or phosphodiesterase